MSHAAYCNNYISQLLIGLYLNIQGEYIVKQMVFEHFMQHKRRISKIHRINCPRDRQKLTFEYFCTSDLKVNIYDILENIFSLQTQNLYIYQDKAVTK